MDALLVIDVQKALVTGAYREHEFIEAAQTAIKRVRERSGVVVFIQHCHSSFEPMKKGNPGWQLHDALRPEDGDVFVEKEASDSFYNTQLDDQLRQRGVDHLVVTGLQTEYCVDATCRSALSRGYRVTLVSNGHTTGESLLSAAQIVAHHNHVLSNLAHPENTIQLCRSDEL